MLEIILSHVPIFSSVGFLVYGVNCLLSHMILLEKNLMPNCAMFVIVLDSLCVCVCLFLCVCVCVCELHLCRKLFSVTCVCL